MGNWKFFIIGIACFMVYRLLHNLYKLIAIKKLFSVYLEYLDNPQFSFHQKKSRIVKLFNNAEIEDFGIYKIKPEGAGYVRDIRTTGFSNITFIDPEVVPQIKGKFHEAIGVFKARVLETINPLFWIEFVLKFPTYFLEYIGLKSGNIFIKLVQLLYWIIGIIIGLEKLGLINIM